ncbi:MAG: hypothetical protein ABS891_08875, partial [Enterococcus casseliflavus]
MNKIELFDLPIDDGNLEETVEEILDRIQRDEVIEHVGVNSNKVVLSRRNAKIREIIQQADMVSADGYSVVRACHWLKKKKIDRVTGIDTMRQERRTQNRAGGNVVSELASLVKPQKTAEENFTVELLVFKYECG